jgi:uncharacterized membrane protein
MDHPGNVRIMIPKARFGGAPIHAMLVPFPIVCLIGALLADIAFIKSEGQVQWHNFADWLLLFGTALAVPAALFGLIDFLGNRSENRPRIGWWHMGLNVTAVVLAVVNNFVHARDGWTAVVPAGITLSVLTVLVLAVSGHLGGKLAYLHVARQNP